MNSSSYFQWDLIIDWNITTHYMMISNVLSNTDTTALLFLFPIHCRRSPVEEEYISYSEGPIIVNECILSFLDRFINALGIY